MPNTPFDRIATVFGATGFVGQAIVQRLAAAGWRVKAVTRKLGAAYHLLPLGTPGQIAPTLFNANDKDSIVAACAGADVVINCIGILAEKRSGDFVRLHTDLPALIGYSARMAGARRFVHVSALGITGSSSRYAITKIWGEESAKSAFGLNTTILRPSVIFGPGDRFFNFFAWLSVFSPILPLIGGGKTRFQPIYVGDVAAAVLAALDTSPTTYSLGGPEIFTIKQILEKTLMWTKRRRFLIPLPWTLAFLKAAVLQYLPGPILTCDHVRQLRTDSLVPDAAPNLATLGIINPMPMTAIVPGYLNPNAQVPF